MQENFKIFGAVEFDKIIAETYIKNHPNTLVIVDDIKNVDNKNIFKKNDAEVIIGGPPCQGFSMAGARIRNGFINDPRNLLFKHYYNIVKSVKPKVFIMENVKGIATIQGGKIFKEILDLFSDENALDGDKYYVYHRVLKATEFGIPQTRERMIIIGILNKEIDLDYLLKKTKGTIKKRLPLFFETSTIWDAISDLSDTHHVSDSVVLSKPPQSSYQKYLCSKSKLLYNHIETTHSSKAIQRMSLIKADENYTKLNENIKSVHSGSYGRLNKNGLSRTITTRFDTPSGGKYIHPIHNRTITPREAARIQSFPDDYIFYGTKSSICKQIGNAVPPKISRFLAVLIKEIINNE
jgi:DNA (cytosine-5)-methyltransferase 1